MSLSGLLEEGKAQLLMLISSSQRAEEINLETPRSGSSWRMEDLLGLGSVDSDTCSPGVDSDDPGSLLRVVLGEYRDLLLHLPSGMVVAPSFNNILEWHGSVHVKQGYYRGGIFKFMVHIPVDYPASAPCLYLYNQVFHPLIDQETGKLDLSPAFPTWKPGRDYIVLVLSFLRKIFFKRELNSYLSTMAREVFVARCEECVAESLRLVYVCHPNSPIPFAPWRRGKSITSLIASGPDTSANAIYEAIRSAATQLPPHIPLHERAEMLSNWMTNKLIPSSLESLHGGD